jgi:prepilin-type N-terminal cleavage/methylation domain-containing protein
MSHRSDRSRGFTLIELMVTVAIVGLLASIALPTFHSLQLRSKQAERAILETSIRRAVDDYWMRESKFPYDLGGGASLLYLYYDNPDTNPTTTKRPWRVRPLNSLDHWNRLSLVVEGGVYYSYRGYAEDFVTTRYQYSFIYGDLDGDRVQNQILKYWYYSGTQLQKWSGGNLPCSDCTVAYEYNPYTF